MSATDRIRVVLVDDHPVVRAGFRRLLELGPGIEVVAEADSGEQAYQAHLKLAPDVVIMDLSMPGMGGIEAARRILAKDPKARILVLSAHEDPIFATRVLEAGALGYLTKRCGPQVLVEAVRAIARGDRYLEHSVAQQLAVGGVNGVRDETKELTAREFEVFRLLAQGKSVNEIAEILFLSPKTVGTYQTRIMQKLDVPNAAGLVRLAIRKGIIEP